MLTREDFERLEEQNLAAYAMRSSRTLGRDHAEGAHPFRTCYQRDRDRIIHSAAFRRLEYKTQVFVIFEGDYYRTRLTHTLEVAQIGRSIGRTLRLNEDLIEAIALAHDLGHPPFGHAGEEALDKIMKDGGALGFNHNLRSFEIVTRFEKRYPDFDGLNLTREVLIGILKHQTNYDEAGFLEKYRDESPTLEAQVVDCADSLAYLNHDVDDGLKSECISVEDLMASELWKRAIDHLGDAVQVNDLEMLRYQVVKALIDMQVRDLIEHTDARLRELDFKNVEQVKSYKGEVVGFSRDMKALRDELQDLLNRKLYHHYRVLRMTTKAKRVLNDLFQVYIHEPFQLPPELFPRDRECEDIEKYEIICNHIAGMTDRAALDEHKRFFNAYTKV
ncbi:MAG TPA: deoxyguanosinetriphosphate triphosphohydrolase [Candidatus Omnitrophota bacterium]|jgi:dGTPase|nr:deoxyguanosinetriphosphate triphosphohydrolase [Candidatus Omnitrophota bacterium]HSA30562.1 deoxyguanosinetriphosphate triphosphohydrolase [Candidatus Omnitrophota bacterium]